MIFRKKRGMIDVRELARQGKVAPVGTKTIENQSNNDGFVEMGSQSNTQSVSTTTPSTMNFFNTPTPTTQANNNLVERITAISKAVSKMEQRLEVIEKKLGVGDSAPPVMW
jgi:hypothetical protein